MMFKLWKIKRQEELLSDCKFKKNPKIQNERGAFPQKMNKKQNWQLIRHSFI